MSAIISSLQERLTTGNVIALSLLLSSSLLASALIYLRTSPAPLSLRGFASFALPGEIFRHPSARADLLFWVTRKLVMPLLLLPSAVSVIVGVGYLTHASLAYLLPADHYVAGPAGPLTICLFTVTMLLAYDLSYYIYHVAQHRIPVLWELHKVHHSAEVLIGVTKDRIHPLDEIMNRAWDGLVVGILYGVWLFFALDPVEATIFGVNVYVMRNIIMMDFVRHTHLKVSFGRWMNTVVLCPHYHQLHHSTNPKHFDKNFGLMLSVWDRLFGTLVIPERGESFSFGLGPPGRDYQSLRGLYLLPLRRMAAHFLPDWRRKQSPGLSLQVAPLRIEIVRDEARFADIAGVWTELWKATGGGVFQSHDWISAWWRNAGVREECSLHIGLAWVDARLVAVLPLVTRRYRGIRVLEWAAKDCSDYCDAVVAGPDAATVLPALWRKVSKSGGFDLAYLSHMRIGALAGSLKSQVGNGISLRPSRRQTVSTGVRLQNWPSGDAWLQSLGKKGRNNHARGWRILETNGPVTFRLLAPTEEFGPALERLYLLKQRWLEANGHQSSLLRNGGVLLHELVRVLAASGRLRLFLLECNGVIVAGSVNILDEGCLQAFFAAYDPAYDRASPGTLLMIEYIRWSFGQCLSHVDFLRGDEGYKNRFVSTRVELDSLVGAATPFGLLAMFADEHLGSARATAIRTAAISATRTAERWLGQTLSRMRSFATQIAADRRDRA